MKTVLTLPPGAIVRVLNKKGESIAQNAEFGQIEIEPFFTSTNGKADLLNGRSFKANGDQVESFVINVSGANGQASKTAVSEKAVIPIIDRVKPAPKVPTPAVKP